MGPGAPLSDEGKMDHARGFSDHTKRYKGRAVRWGLGLLLPLRGKAVAGVALHASNYARAPLDLGLSPSGERINVLRISWGTCGSVH